MPKRMDNTYLQGPALEPIPTNRPVRSLFSRAGFSVLGYFISAQLSGLLLGFLFAFLYGEDYTSQPYFLSIAGILQYVFALPVCFFIMRKEKRVPIQKKTIKLRYLLATISIAVMLGQAGSIIGRSFSSAISVILDRNINDPLNEQMFSMSLLENVIVLCIAAPIFEELLCRKLILDRITRYGNGIALLLSGLLFGVTHCNVNQFFYAFLIGVLFGYIYLKSGLIIYPILLHAAFNFLLGVVPLVLESRVEQFDPGLITANPFQAGYLIYIGIIWILAIVGIALSCILFKKIKSDASEFTHNIGRYLSCAILNPGVVVSCIMSFALYALNILLPS